MRTNRLLMMGLFTATLVAQGCAADNDPGRSRSSTAIGGVSKYDVEHPDWKLHPGAVLVEREDLEFIYDVTVMDKKLVVPTKAHEAFLKTIVPQKTILIGRQNEENYLKNKGFIRGVLSMTQVGENTEITTQQLALADVVRGNLNTTTTKIVGIAPQVGASPQARGIRPQKHFTVGSESPLHLPLALDKTLDYHLAPSLQFNKNVSSIIEEADGVKMEASKDWVAGVQATLDLKGSLHIQPVIDFYVDVDVDLDFGWFSVDIDVDVNRAKAGIGLEYEAQGGFNIELAGSIGGQMELSAINTDLNLWPACVIGGLPCSVNLNMVSNCSVQIGGAFQYKTTKNARVYGTPTLGVEYSDGGLHGIPSSAFNYEAPEFNNDPPNGATASRPTPTAKSATVKASGQVQCTFEPRIEFFVGEKFHWWKIDAEAGAGAYVTPAQVLTAKAAACWTRDFDTNSWRGFRWGAGLSGKIQPRVGGEIVATFAGHGLDLNAQVDIGNGVDLFDLHVGSLGVDGEPSCL